MDKLEQEFVKLFGKSETPYRFFCPGRVNLIGEHIDYLGGLVMPAAISLGITGLIRKNESNRFRVYSTDFHELNEFNVDELPNKKQEHWSDYILGVVCFLKKEGIPVDGFDFLIDSSLPKGSGLSSSAALEVLAYYSLSILFDNQEPERTKMALDCQQIENEFIGVNCGIMDQFAVANGRKNHAIQLNCDSLEFDHVPLNLREYSLLIINSNKPRQLAESAYNQRRAECDEALQILRTQNPSLSNLVRAQLDNINIIGDNILRKRAKHAITENKRVLDSASALEKNDIKRFGNLMSESHISLSENFEVSSTELDFIAYFMQNQEACLGARMTGAGFGGCCIAIVETEKISMISEILVSNYTAKFAFAPSLFSCYPSDGVRM